MKKLAILLFLILIFACEIEKENKENIWGVLGFSLKIIFNL